MDWSVIKLAVPILGVGLLATLKVCLAAIFFGMLLGVVLGFGALSRLRAVRFTVLAYVDFVRGTPLLVQIFLVYFALPVIGVNFDEYWAGVTALSLNAAGFICEKASALTAARRTCASASPVEAVSAGIDSSSLRNPMTPIA